jgi:hypothetical protein
MERANKSRRSVEAVALSLAMLLLVTLVPAHSEAAPYSGVAAVSGSIVDTWLDDDRCYFRIAIDWSNHSGLVGRTVDATPLVLNESTDSYERIASSQGWRVGDTLNATLSYTWDEFGEYYWVRLLSKNDENYASPLSYFEQNPFVFYLLLIVVLYVLLQIVLIVLFKRRGRRGRYEGPDYIQYRRRI